MNSPLAGMTILFLFSPFLASLVMGCLCDQEKVFITLCDISFSEVMAMLNLVYVGRYCVCLLDSI